MLAISAVYFSRNILFPAPSCNDQKQNGYESGIDCGGVCSLRCVSEVSPLTVLWAKAVRSGPGLYDLVGMINNNNINNASKELVYTFTMYDLAGKVMGEITGSTVAPLGGNFPVIIQSIPLKTIPTNVVVSLQDTAHYSVKESPSSPTIKIVQRRYEYESIPRVYSTIVNTKQIEITNLPVKALLFDDKDNVYAVAQTVVPYLEKEGIKEVIFTWNEKLPFTPTRIGIYPIFDPFDAIGY